MTDLAGQPDWAAVIRPHKFTDDSAAVMIDAGKLRQAAAELDRLRATNAALEKERDEAAPVIRAAINLNAGHLEAVYDFLPDDNAGCAAYKRRIAELREKLRALTPTPAPQERQNG